MALRVRQRGVALIALLAMLVLGSSWYLVDAMNVASQRTAMHRAHNAQALGTAKQALLGWATKNAMDNTDPNPGRLPCPEAPGFVGDPANEGVMSSFCGAGTVVGRLPWRSLGLPKQVDAAGEPLWYVVSNGWKLNVGGATLGINANSAGQLAVDSQPNAAVALIIAPGAPMHVVPNAVQLAAGCVARAQSRGATPPNYLDYVECLNLGGASARTAAPENGARTVQNDQVVVVTAAEVLAAVEAPVALRLRRDVAPQLRALYASAQWGGSVAAPIYPYAARLHDGAGTTFNPDIYRGRSGTSQGLIPMTASTCNALTAARCDPAFVQWNAPASVSAVQTGGTATSFSADCSASTPSQVECTVTYSLLACALFCSINADVRVQASAPNLAMTLKTLDPSSASGLSSPTLIAPIQPDGSAQARYSGRVFGGSSGLCGPLISVLCTGVATIRIPISVFQDHPLVSSTPADSWHWFTANRWFEVAYYAPAPSQLPPGPHDCVAAVDCITVAGASLGSNIRATLTLAGRSLLGTAGANRTFADFLDSAQNRDGDQAFEQATVNKTFNDRFVAIDP